MERALLTLGRSRRGLTQEQEAQPSRYSAHPHGPRHAPGSGTAPARLHHAPGPAQPSKREVLVPSVFPPSRKLTLSVTRGSEDHGRTGASMHLPSDSSPFIDWLLSPSPERHLQGHASRTQPRWTPPESSTPKTPSPQVKWGGPVHAPGGLRHFLRHCRCRMSGVQGPPGLVPTLFQPVLLLPSRLWGPILLPGLVLCTLSHQLKPPPRGVAWVRGDPFRVLWGFQEGWRCVAGLATCLSR